MDSRYLIFMEQESLFDAGEQVSMKVRKHWMVYVGDVVAHGVGLVLFTFLSGLLSFVIEGFASYVGMMFGVLMLFTWCSFFYVWTRHYCDVWYITDRHIIAVDQREILTRDVTFMEFGRIQDVFFEKDGLLQSFFGYGKLRVQSAGSEQELVISSVAHVEDVARTITELRTKARVLSI